jgi:hypothetical protein
MDATELIRIQNSQKKLLEEQDSRRREDEKTRREKEWTTILDTELGLWSKDFSNEHKFQFSGWYPDLKAFIDSYCESKSTKQHRMYVLNYDQTSEIFECAGKYEPSNFTKVTLRIDDVGPLPICKSCNMDLSYHDGSRGFTVKHPFMTGFDDDDKEMDRLLKMNGLYTNKDQ